MTGKAPEPLVSPDVDLSKLDGFMLDTVRLLGSELAALSTPEEFKAAVLLWCWAWKQQPAASLPDDDRILSSFARVPLGRWRKIKAMALRGFVKCSDGRLYHKVLSEDATRAWEALRKRRERTQAATDARKNARNGERNGDRDEQRDDERNVERDDGRDVDRNEVPTVARDGTGRDGTIQEKGESPPAGRLGAVNGAAGRATRLPPDFVVSPELLAEAEQKRRELGLPAANLRQEAAQFIAWQRRKAAESFDWRQSWLSWALKAQADPGAAAAKRKEYGPL